MEFGEYEILRNEENIRLIKTGCRNGKEAFCVIGGGATTFFDDYEDALDEFNLRWMKVKFGEQD
mgnify:CR=1 FL=1